MAQIMDADGTVGASRRRALALAGALAPVLVGVGVSPAAAGGPPVGGDDPRSGRRGLVRPVRTTVADWQAVARALGRPGRLMGGTVYRVGFPRTDLRVTSYGVSVKAGLSLGSYVAFARYPDGRTLVMGDLVVTEGELQRLTDALHAHGLEQTGIHKHLLAHTPAVWWSHVHGMAADPVRLARAVRSALDVTATPGPTKPGTPPPLDLNTRAIDAALGAKGTNDGGIYRFTFRRRETVSDQRRVLPPAMGVTTVIGFQPVGGGRAAVNGDFVMTADEVNPVIEALRRGKIDVIEVHNHALHDNPRLFYTHFWAVDDAARLARALRPAIDATDVTPAT